MFNNLRVNDLIHFLSGIDNMYFSDKEIQLLDLMEGIEHNNPYHLEGNVARHTELVCTHMLDKFYTPKKMNKVISYYISLLHDSGKVFTMNKIQKDNFNHFYEHEMLSGIIAEQLLKFSKLDHNISPLEIAMIKKVIQLHMINFSTINIQKKKKYIEDMMNYYMYILLLKYSDISGMKMSEELLPVENRDGLLNEALGCITELFGNSYEEFEYRDNLYNAIKVNDLISYFANNPITKKTLVVLIGTPLSGKTTIRNKLVEYFSSNGKTVDINSRDDFRFSISKSYELDKTLAKEVNILFVNKLNDFYSNDVDILISDNTNKTSKVRLPQINRIKNRSNYDILYIYIDFIPLYKKVENGISRKENLIPAKVILEHQAILEYPLLSREERNITNLSILEIM